MIDPVECPCGNEVTPDSVEHAEALAVAGGTLLCPTCDTDDVQAREKVVADLDARQNAERAESMRTLLAQAGVPGRSINAVVRTPPAPKFEPHPNQRPAFDAVSSWSVRGGIVVLAGTKGTGKTTIAARGALMAIYHGTRVTWRPTTEVVSGMWSHDDEIKNAAERLVYRGTGALILDDLDMAKTTPAALETLGALVDRWYANEQPLIVTTNALTPSVLVDRYGITGERISSRLQSDGAWVEVNGVDLRTVGR